MQLGQVPFDQFIRQLAADLIQIAIFMALVVTVAKFAVSRSTERNSAATVIAIRHFFILQPFSK